jgi:prepilin-type N-terminal cleavage/methylation domain-containing protein
METLLSPRKPVKRFRQRGFTLIEMMVSILVLTIGLVGTAALMSSSVNMGAHARYASTAALLASEKMEDLDRFPDNDPNLAPGGNLAADVTGYSDSVQISSANGNINETTTAGGVTYLYTQNPDGTVFMTVGGTLPATTSDMLTFDRRWQIVANPTVGANVITGAVQITVLVTLTNKTLNPPVTYQTSLVHP